MARSAHVHRLHEGPPSDSAISKRIAPLPGTNDAKPAIVRSAGGLPKTPLPKREDLAGSTGLVDQRLIVQIPTRRDVQRRVFILVGSLAAMQLVLDAIDPFFGRWTMFVLRLSGAALAAGGAVLFEMYKVRREPS